MNVPITKPTIGTEEVEAAIEVVSSGFLVQGKKTKEVEEHFANRVERKYAVMVSNGTSALTTALMSLDLKSSDEVIVPAFTFYASASCVLYAGAKPVFADVNLDTFNINPKDIEKKMTKNTKAIIAVNLFGHPFAYPEVKKIAKKNKLTLIEDAAQSHGSTYKWKESGKLGDISTYSFYGSKIITCGEGGMILTDEDKIYQKLVSYRSHGININDPAYLHSDLGYNYRVTDIQSAILLQQSKKLDSFIKLRQKAAAYYTDKLASVDGIVTPVIKSDFTHSFSCYTLRITSKFGNRDKILAKLNENGVGARVYYPGILPEQPIFKKLGYKFSKNDYPEAVQATQEVLSLPLFPTITREEQDYVIEQLLSAHNS